LLALVESALSADAIDVRPHSVVSTAPHWNSGRRPNATGNCSFNSRARFGRGDRGHRARRDGFGHGRFLYRCGHLCAAMLPLIVWARTMTHNYPFFENFIATHLRPTACR